MRLFQILQLLDAQVAPDQCKLHLAGWNGEEDRRGEWLEEHNMHRYRLSRRTGSNELDGRLIVRFKRPGRQSYLLGENWSQAIEVAEVRPERIV